MNKQTLIIIGVVAVVAILAITVGAIAALVMNFQAIVDWLTSAGDANKLVYCADSPTCTIAQPIVYGILLTFVVITGFAYTTLLERKIIAFLQQRVGPNRVGPGGMMQPAADAVKLIFKEDIIPDKADVLVYYLAPLIKTIPIIIVVAVIPMGPEILFPWFDGYWYVVPLALANVNVGILWILGITSLGTYGIVLAGWSSNNKYAMLGGLRASAQMISYELTLSLSMAVPVLIAGSMNVNEIINHQKYIWDWYVFQNPLAAGILMIALFAEVSRAPFDLVEAEQELTAGFMTEYSGMKFAMFMMAEYIGMIMAALITISLFFGGYHLFPVDNVGLLGPVIMIGKVLVFLFFFIWVRATLPRIRYDRLMAFGWKILLPLAFVAVAWTAIAVTIRETNVTLYIATSTVFFLVIVVGGFYFLSADRKTEDTKVDDWANDPLITGQQGGARWTGLNILGGLIAIPFVLVENTIKAIEKFGETVDPTEEKAIVPREKGGD